MGQAVPEIPLSVGSKLELLSSLPNFRILPRTLTHLSAYAYCHVYITLGAHAQEGYGTVCLFVCLIVDIVRFYGVPKVLVTLF